MPCTGGTCSGRGPRGPAACGAVLSARVLCVSNAVCLGPGFSTRGPGVVLGPGGPVTMAGPPTDNTAPQLIARVRPLPAPLCPSLRSLMLSSGSQCALSLSGDCGAAHAMSYTVIFPSHLQIFPAERIPWPAWQLHSATKSLHSGCLVPHGTQRWMAPLHRPAALGFEWLALKTPLVQLSEFALAACLRPLLRRPQRIAPSLCERGSAMVLDCFPACGVWPPASLAVSRFPTSLSNYGTCHFFFFWQHVALGQPCQVFNFRRIFAAGGSGEPAQSGRPAGGRGGRGRGRPLCHRAASTPTAGAHV